MRDAVIDAVTRYGTQFSSSRSYLQSPQYNELEPLLDEMFGGHVLVTPTTSLGHLATLPVLVESTRRGAARPPGPRQRADGGQPAARQGHDGRADPPQQHGAAGGDDPAPRADARAHLVHGRRRLLDVRRPRARSTSCARCWTATSSCTSTSTTRTASAGRASTAAARRWTRWATHPRLVAACSLNKSFATAGGAIVFPNAECKRKVRTTGGPMIFSGPVQPPLLGAAIQSARIHLSDELPVLQAALRERIELFTDLADEFCIPLASRDVTPIRYIPLGLPIAHPRRAPAARRRRPLHELRHVPGGADEAHRRARHADAAPHARGRPRARRVARPARPGGAGARRRGGPAPPREDRRARHAGADARAPPLRRRARRGRVGLAAGRARHVHRRRPAVPRARVRGARRAARGRVGLPLLRRARRRGQGRAGDVLHGGAVEGRHDGLRRGLRAGRAASRRGPVLPDLARRSRWARC